MIRVSCTASFSAERKYILEVMLREFLGLDYRVEASDSPDWRLCLDESADAGAIYIPDVFFRIPAEQWATPASMPQDPIVRCSADQTPHDTSQPENGLPVLYGSPSQTCGLAVKGPNVHLAVDVFGSSFYMLTRFEEFVLEDRFEYGRFPAALSLSKRLGILHRPIVNEYLELLWSAMQLLWPRLERKPHQYRLWPTHDVDLPFASAGRPLSAVLRSAADDAFRRRKPGLACRRLAAVSKTRGGDLSSDPFWTFELLMESSEAHGQASTFYFLADESAFSLKRAELISLIRRIRERGHYIGVQPPFDSYRKPDAVLQAKNSVERAMELAGVNQEAIGGRQHALQWLCPDTWQAYADAGMSHDSSLCFTEASGFRSGTCFDYPVFNLRSRQQLALRERPLIVTQAALYDHEKLPPELVLARINELKSQCRKYSGNFVILWQNSELYENRQMVMYQQAIWP